MRQKRPKKCERCLGARIAEILYGFPNLDSDLEAALEAGTTVLGGCVVTDDDPQWQCLDCGFEWG